MAKWFGKIGYAITEAITPGEWVVPDLVERECYGELTTDRRKRQNSGGVNDDITLSSTISIIADPFALQNCSYMAYAEIFGTKWKISDIEIQFPRLILTIGGVYNG